MSRKHRTRPQIPHKPASPRYLLDQFSQADVANWQRQADAELEYSVKIFYHLEAQRGLQPPVIREALAWAKPTSKQINGWVRIVDFRYSLEPLSTAGSFRKSGRFNIAEDIDASRFTPFPALYLAEDYVTAYAEKFGAGDIAARDGLSGQEFALRRPTSFTSVRLNGQLHQLFDLTEVANLRRFVKILAKFEMTKELLALAREAKIPKPYLIVTTGQLRKQLLAKDWRRWPSQFGIPTNTQVFGRLVKDAGFEGVIYPSARGPKRCIALFPDKLRPGDSFLELADPSPDQVRYPRLDGSTWQHLSSRT